MLTIIHIININDGWPNGNEIIELLWWINILLISQCLLDSVYVKFTIHNHVTEFSMIAIAVFWILKVLNGHRSCLLQYKLTCSNIRINISQMFETSVYFSRISSLNHRIWSCSCLYKIFDAKLALSHMECSNKILTRNVYTYYVVSIIWSTHAFHLRMNYYLFLGNIWWFSHLLPFAYSKDIMKWLKFYLILSNVDYYRIFITRPFWVHLTQKHPFDRIENFVWWLIWLRCKQYQWQYQIQPNCNSGKSIAWVH